MTGRKIAARLKNSLYSYEINPDTGLQCSLEYSYLQVQFLVKKKKQKNRNSLV